MKRFVLLALVLASATATANAQQQFTRQQMMAVRNACEADIRRVCAGVQPGGGRILQCVQANAEQISLPCKETLAEIRAQQAQK
ncbi:hypothetical protein HDIA_3941 [Hartmannibacter diazotrophicus]|uniref:Cysteine rich repeat n=1 Tax=Hartmannibacter diazotrophicus TaxID=1482074 RepID=A0A2C9DAY1_9HYPH|nr:cysteine rich repeat-containing protein [Hartmannibacter diazotrophicus]SON57482.1 hypothetical protein HDIA_3941 [Hartmannibacter diazotrophicus]